MMFVRVTWALNDIAASPQSSQLSISPKTHQILKVLRYDFTMFGPKQIFRESVGGTSQGQSQILELLGERFTPLIL